MSELFKLTDKLHTRITYIQSLINNCKCDKDTMYKLIVETTTANVELSILEKKIKQLIDKK